MDIANPEGVVSLYCRRAFTCPFSVLRRPAITQWRFYLDFVTCGVIVGFFIIIPVVIVSVTGIISAEVAWRLFIFFHWEAQKGSVERFMGRDLCLARGRSRLRSFTSHAAWNLLFRLGEVLRQVP